MKLKDLLAKREQEHADALVRYDGIVARQKGITTTVRSEGRKELTALEQREFDSLEADKANANAAVVRAEASVAELRQAVVEEDKAERQAAEAHETSAGQQDRSAQSRAHDQVARIGQEPRTYTRESDRTGKRFLSDIAALHLNPANFAARERLSRHMQEEYVERGDKLARTLERGQDSSGQQERAVGTGAFAGLVVPQYLVDLYAPAATALRPFADACNQHNLPEQGMTLNISRITTSTAAALQATENSAVQNTDMDDTLLPVTVQTNAGQQTLSRQAIDRGAGVEDVMMQDLLKQYAVRLDSTIINQATTGLSAAATAVAYTDASPTAPELYPKILQAAAAAEAGLLGLAQVDLAVMHSRRWYWLQSQMTSTWPMFAQGGNIPTQSAGSVNPGSRYGSGFRGYLPSGLAVIVDNNLATNLGAGTNEDEIYIVPSDECHLWEDPDAPMMIRAEQPAAASLGVLFVVYGYFAYTFGRYPAGVQKLGGTGLVTPTF